MERKPQNQSAREPRAIFWLVEKYQRVWAGTGGEGKRVERMKKVEGGVEEVKMYARRRWRVEEGGREEEEGEEGRSGGQQGQGRKSDAVVRICHECYLLPTSMRSAPMLVGRRSLTTSRTRRKK